MIKKGLKVRVLTGKDKKKEGDIILKLDITLMHFFPGPHC